LRLRGKEALMWQRIKALILIFIFATALSSPGDIVSPIFFSVSFIYIYFFGIPKKAKTLNKSDILPKILRNFGFAILILVFYGFGELNSYNFYANSVNTEGVIVNKIEKICSKFKRKRSTPTYKYPCWDVDIKVGNQIIQKPSFGRDKYKLGQKVFITYAKNDKNNWLNLSNIWFFTKSYDEKPRFDVFKNKQNSQKTYFDKFDELSFVKYMIFIFSLILYGIRWSYIYKSNKYYEPPNYSDTELLKSKTSENNPTERIEPHF
jgi:hypothetical protein